MTGKLKKSIIEGQYNERFIWLSRQVLGKQYHEAVATYLHELDHRHGNDYSQKFSAALTGTIETVVETIMKKPELYRALEKEWEKA